MNSGPASITGASEDARSKLNKADLGRPDALVAPVLLATLVITRLIPATCCRLLQISGIAGSLFAPPDGSAGARSEPQAARLIVGDRSGGRSTQVGVQSIDQVRALCCWRLASQPAQQVAQQARTGRLKWNAGSSRSRLKRFPIIDSAAPRDESIIAILCVCVRASACSQQRGAHNLNRPAR